MRRLAGQRLPLYERLQAGCTDSVADGYSYSAGVSLQPPYAIDGWRGPASRPGPTGLDTHPDSKQGEFFSVGRVSTAVLSSLAFRKTYHSSIL